MDAENYEQNESVLTKIFSSVTAPKILDFLLSHKGLDYSVKEIAENCDVSVKTIMREIPHLESLGLISESRKIGNAPLYKINQKLRAIELLSEFSIAIAQTQQYLEPQRKQSLQEVIEMTTSSISENN